MTIRMTEKELKEFFSKTTKKNKISANKKQKDSIDLNNQVEKLLENTKEKKLGIKVKENIINLNEKCEIKITYNQDYVSILFVGARLLSINQIFSILERRTYEIFKYKKMWQFLVQKAIEGKEDLPWFEQDCELVLLRQAPRLVDNDALSTMFKYIIDALKVDKEKNKKYFILKEDNPIVVNNIKLIQIKSKEYVVGIRVQRNKLKNNDSAEDFLEKEYI